jgi:hypothetical protein
MPAEFPFAGSRAAGDSRTGQADKLKCHLPGGKLKMKVRVEKAGSLGIRALMMAFLSLLAFTGAASAEGQWWSSDPAVEDAKKRLYRVKGIHTVFFHRNSAGEYQPHLVVDKTYFSLAQQRAACEIIWQRYGINYWFEYQGFLEEDEMLLPVNCAENYPELGSTN